MPMYEFKCKQCRLVYTLMSRTDPKCPRCNAKEAARVFSFNPLTSFQPHYNISVGKWVNSEREFKDALKVASANATLRTGIEHNFVPVDARDREAVGATDEGMDNHYRTHHNNPDLMKEDLSGLSN